MKKSMLLIATLALCANFAFADRWVGGPQGGATGQSGITTATIEGVRVQLTSGYAYFSIIQSNGTIPANRIWRWNATTAAGANVLAAVLAAKAAGTPIQFLETTLISGQEYNFENFTFGNSLL